MNAKCSLKHQNNMYDLTHLKELEIVSITIGNIFDCIVNIKIIHLKWIYKMLLHWQWEHTGLLSWGSYRNVHPDGPTKVHRRIPWVSMMVKHSVPTRYHQLALNGYVLITNSIIYRISGKSINKDVAHWHVNSAKFIKWICN